MATRTEVFQFDTTPPVEGTLTDNGLAVGLLGATVEFRMEPAPESGLTVPLLIRSAVIVNPNAVEGDPEYGLVRYVWQAGDTDVPGIYHGYFRVTFGDGSARSFGHAEILIYRIPVAA